MANLVPLPGSVRRPLPGAQIIGDVDPQQMLNHVSVYFRQAANAPLLPDVIEFSSTAPRTRRYYTHQEAAECLQPDAQTVADFQAYLADNGITVKQTTGPCPGHVIHVSGTMGDFQEALGVDAKQYAHSTGNYRGRTGPLNLPAEFVPHVHSIFGLDNRRIGSSYLRVMKARVQSRKQPFVPTALAKLYDFPANLDGKGQTVAILAFNGKIADTGISAPGGYNLTALQNYFNQLGVPMPQISNVVVHGPGNTPNNGSNPNDVSGEIMLDIQMVGLLAPGAKIVVYFSEFTEVGWVDVLQAVVNDTTHNPSICSISYGNPETSSDAANANTRGSLWTHGAIVQADLAFKVAAAKGLSIFAASGDDGSPDGNQDGRAHSDYPSSSAFVTGVGGTSLLANAAGITQETVWNDGPGSAGGGGVSALFALPDYQQNANVPASVNPGHHIGRGVPDVAAVADPSTGLLIVDNNGTPQQIGGTSASAPMWAALTARINQGVGHKVGFLNPLLYAQIGTGAFHDITKGNNGSYRAKIGWDACTGLGTPDGARLMQALNNVPPTAPHSESDPVRELAQQVAALNAQVQSLLSPFGQAVIRATTEAAPAQAEETTLTGAAEAPGARA